VVTAMACQAGEPPFVLDPGGQQASVGEPWQLRILATDPDGDRIDFSVEAPPVVTGGLNIRPLPDNTSIQLEWTPTEEAVGQQVITVGASDGEHTTRIVLFVDVALGMGGAPRWQKPVETGGVLDLYRESCFELELLVDDQDSESVELVQLEGPDSATISQDPSGYGGLWSWCPVAEELDRGHWNLVLGADDGTNDVVELDFVVALRGDGVPDEPDDGEDTGNDTNEPPDDGGKADDPGDSPDDIGDCCETAGEGGCSSPTVEQCVCDEDWFCCQTAWDATCVEKVTSLGCGTCQATDAPSPCCETSATAGCSADSPVETCVCAGDAFCCETAWDATCVSDIELLGCGTCS
jgi:hypothetical protein